MRKISAGTNRFRSPRRSRRPAACAGAVATGHARAPGAAARAATAARSRPRRGSPSPGLPCAASAPGRPGLPRGSGNRALSRPTMCCPAESSEPTVSATARSMSSGMRDWATRRVCMISEDSCDIGRAEALSAMWIPVRMPLEATVSSTVPSREDSVTEICSTCSLMRLNFSARSVARSCHSRTMRSVALVSPNMPHALPSSRTPVAAENATNPITDALRLPRIGDVSVVTPVRSNAERAKRETTRRTETENAPEVETGHAARQQRRATEAGTTNLDGRSGGQPRATPRTRGPASPASAAVPAARANDAGCTGLGYGPVP